MESLILVGPDTFSSQQAWHWIPSEPLVLITCPVACLRLTLFSIYFHSDRHAHATAYLHVSVPT
jgi:hypothetical protein